MIPQNVILRSCLVVIASMLLFAAMPFGTVKHACAEDICEGDFDTDCDVDGSDLATFAEDFGRTNCSGDCEGDFDSDNDVDGSDLAVFAADFGRTDCLSPDECEPNETCLDAYDLGTLTDVPVSIEVLAGTVGVGDSDWYAFYAEDVPEGSTNSDSYLLSFTSSPGGMIRYSVWQDNCGSGTNVCPNMEGNCTVFPPNKPDVVNDSHDYFVEVKSVDGNCQPYTLEVKVGFACDQGLSNCSWGVCTDLASDPDNCGACWVVCEGQEPRCCAGVCTDVANNPDNCGACGNACSEGQSCVSWLGSWYCLQVSLWFAKIPSTARTPGIRTYGRYRFQVPGILRCTPGGSPCPQTRMQEHPLGLPIKGLGGVFPHSSTLFS